MPQINLASLRLEGKTGEEEEEVPVRRSFLSISASTASGGSHHRMVCSNGCSVSSFAVPGIPRTAFQMAEAILLHAAGAAAGAGPGKRPTAALAEMPPRKEEDLRLPSTVQGLLRRKVSSVARKVGLKKRTGGPPGPDPDWGNSKQWLFSSISLSTAGLCGEEHLARASFHYLLHLLTLMALRGRRLRAEDRRGLQRLKREVVKICHLLFKGDLFRAWSLPSPSVLSSTSSEWLGSVLQLVPLDPPPSGMLHPLAALTNAFVRTVFSLSLATSSGRWRGKELLSKEVDQVCGMRMLIIVCVCVWGGMRGYIRLAIQQRRPHQMLGNCSGIMQNMF